MSQKWQRLFTKRKIASIPGFVDIIHNLFAFDLTALSRVKQTTPLSSGEEKNLLGKALRSLQDRLAQSRISKSIGAMQFR